MKWTRQDVIDAVGMVLTGLQPEGKQNMLAQLLTAAKANQSAVIQPESMRIPPPGAMNA